MAQLREAVRRLAASQKTSKGVSLYSTLVNRPLGRLCAAVAYVAGLSPNTVTLISGGFTFTGIAILMLVEPTVLTGVAVWLLLAFGFVLDSADGQVARLTGQSSAAGEWLDHMVDAAKMVLLHAGVLIGWWRFGDYEDQWLLVPVSYQVVAVVTFSGVTTVGLLKRGSASTTQAGVSPPPKPSLLRAVLLLPGDYGMLCLAFVTWGSATVFPVVYVVLLVLNAAMLVAFLVKWHKELSQLRQA